MGAFVLAAGATMLAFTSGAAQAATGTVSYFCQINNNVVASPAGSYPNRNLTITVTPSSVPTGTSQTIKIDLGGDGTTASGPSIFNNGSPFTQAAGAYQPILLVSINDGALTNVIATPNSNSAAANASFFTNGVTGSWTSTFPEGVNTVELEGIVFNSLSSGPAWDATGSPTDFSDAYSFDSICSADATDPGGNGGNGAPAENAVNPSISESDELNGVETQFTVTAVEPTGTGSPTGEPTSTGTSTEPPVDIPTGSVGGLGIAVLAAVAGLGAYAWTRRPRKAHNHE